MTIDTKALLLNRIHKALLAANMTHPGVRCYAITNGVLVSFLDPGTPYYTQENGWLRVSEHTPSIGDVEYILQEAGIQPQVVHGSLVVEDTP